MSESVGIVQLIPGSSGQSFFSGPVPVYVRSSYVTPSKKYQGITITAYAELVPVSSIGTIKTALAKYKVKITRPELLPKQEQKKEGQKEGDKQQQQKQGIKGKYVQFEGLEEYGSGKMTLIKQMYDSIAKEESKLAVEQSFAVGDRTPTATVEQQYDPSKLHEKLTAEVTASSTPTPYYLGKEYEFEVVLPERYTYEDNDKKASFMNLRLEVLGPLTILVGELAADIVIKDTKAGVLQPKTLTLSKGFPMAIPLTTVKSVGGLPEVLTSSEEESDVVKPKQPKQPPQTQEGQEGQPKQTKQTKGTTPASEEEPDVVQPKGTKPKPADEPLTLETARTIVAAAQREVARLSTIKTTIDASPTASQSEKNEADRNLNAARQKLFRANAELAGLEASLPVEPNSKEALRMAITNARRIANLLPTESRERQYIDDQVHGINMNAITTRFEIQATIKTLDAGAKFAKQMGDLFTKIEEARGTQRSITTPKINKELADKIAKAYKVYTSVALDADSLYKVSDEYHLLNTSISLAELAQARADVEAYRKTLGPSDSKIAVIDIALENTSRLNSYSIIDDISEGTKTLRALLLVNSTGPPPPVIPTGPVTPPVIPTGPVTPPVIPADLTTESDFTKIVKDAIRDVDLVKLEGENKIEECKKVFIDGIVGLLDQIQKDVETETNVAKLNGYLGLLRKIYEFANDTSQYPACLRTKAKETRAEITTRIAPYIDLQTTLNGKIAAEEEAAAKKAEAEAARIAAEAAAKKAADDKAEADRAAAEATRLATEAARIAAEEAAKKAEAARIAAEEAAKKAEAAQAAADEAVKKAADEKAAAEAQAKELAAEKAAKLEALIVEANDDFVGLFIGAVQQNITTGSVAAKTITDLGEKKDSIGVKLAESKLNSVIPKLLAIDNTYASSIIAVCNITYTNEAGDIAKICKNTAFKGLRQTPPVAAENVESTDEEATRIAAAKKAADEAEAARIAAEKRKADEAEEKRKADEAEAARIAAEAEAKRKAAEAEAAKKAAEEEAARIAAEAEAKRKAEAEAAAEAEAKRKADEEAARVAEQARQQAATNLTAKIAEAQTLAGRIADQTIRDPLNTAITAATSAMQNTAATTGELEQAIISLQAAINATPQAQRLLQLRAAIKTPVVQPTQPVVQPPPVPGLAKPKTCPLTNVGNSCYINAAIQMFAQIPEIKDFGNKTLPSLLSATTSCDVNVPIIQAFYSIIKKYINTTDNSNINIEKIKVGNSDAYSMIVDNLRAVQDDINEQRRVWEANGQQGTFTANKRTQQTSVEFIDIVIDALGCFAQDVTQPFTFSLKKSYAFEDGTVKPSVVFPATNLVLPIEHNSIQEGINSYNTREVVENIRVEVDGIEEEKNGTLADTIVVGNKQTTLLLSLNRTLFDSRTRTRTKNTSKVDVSKVITVSGVNFKIQGAIIHSGTEKGGHYVYQHFSPDGKVAWTADDDKIIDGPSRYDPTTQGVFFVYRRVEGDWQGAAPQTKKGRGRTRRRRNVSYKSRPKRKGTYKSTRRR